MSLGQETRELRQRVEQWSREADTDLPRHYALRYPPLRSLGMYRRLRTLVGLLLRRLGLRRSPPLEPWLPALKHLECSEGTNPFVIWAVGTDRDTLREACRGFISLQAALPGWFPILITDVADFSFFSRLGWLVEYVPARDESPAGYSDRKRRYLAWRYKNAPVLPASAGLEEAVKVQGLLVG